MNYAINQSVNHCTSSQVVNMKNAAPREMTAKNRKCKTTDILKPEIFYSQNQAL